MENANMDSRDETLLAILAKTDAVFWPIRNHDTPGRRAFYERRRAFLSAGLPWASGAASEAGRKAAQRELDALRAEGLVKTYNPRGARTLGVRLTGTADDCLRRKLGLATYADALGFLDELYRRREDPDGFDGIGTGTGGGLPWSSEQALTGIRWGDNDKRVYYVLLTEDLLPLLWRGLVESNSSVQGHVWYGLTAEGYELAAGRDETGEACLDYPPPLPEPGDDEAFAFYHDRRREEIDAIESATPKDTRDLGDIPLPVCPILRRWRKQSPAPAATE
jgi:hypothetical protein